MSKEKEIQLTDWRICPRGFFFLFFFFTRPEDEVEVGVETRPAEVDPLLSAYRLSASNLDFATFTLLYTTTFVWINTFSGVHLEKRKRKWLLNYSQKVTLNLPFILHQSNHQNLPSRSQSQTPTNPPSYLTPILFRPIMRHPTLMLQFKLLEQRIYLLWRVSRDYYCLYVTQIHSTLPL